MSIFLTVASSQQNIYSIQYSICYTNSIQYSICYTNSIQYSICYTNSIQFVLLEVPPCGSVLTHSKLPELPPARPTPRRPGQKYTQHTLNRYEQRIGAKRASMLTMHVQAPPKSESTSCTVHHFLYSIALQWP